MFYRTIALSAALACAVAGASAQSPVRVRGTITAADGATVHIAPNDGGDDTFALTPDTKVTVVSTTTLAAIQPGSFIGTAATTQDDGTLVAVEVHVFPESMRGAGEGHRPFDLGPKSTMTNGTVGQEVVGKVGQMLTVRFKGGEKQVVVPPSTPVVTLGPGNPSMLAVGAHVIAFLQKGPTGTLAASNVLVGQNGLVPPM